MVQFVKPTVRLVGRPGLDIDAIDDYVRSVGGHDWIERMYETGMIDPEDSESRSGEVLTEFGGRLCYRSWAPELNPNVTKVREDSKEYLANVLASGHGSVLEHGYYVFVFQNVSRVFTHELVRHRAGVSISQESMRYVRLTDIPMWIPDWAQEDEELMRRLASHVADAEMLQSWMTDHFRLNEAGIPFSEKKARTSFMRRFAPDGVATSMLWGANIRALRHIISMRTDNGAEEEIRLVFDAVAEMMRNEAPNLFADYQREPNGRWTTENWKV